MRVARQKIVTNNKKVRDSDAYQSADEFVNGDAFQVITRCRDLVHQGWKLVTHPLAGSLKPGENPYRTVIMEAHGALDMQSLSVIEAAIEATRKFQVRWEGLVPIDKEIPQELLRVRDDFMTVDYYLFRSAIER